MIKRIAGLALIALMSTTARAASGLTADLFNFENKTSSFTVDVNTERLSRMSIQVVYSTPTLVDVNFGNAAISTIDDTIQSTAHGLATAEAVLLASAPATAPSPLATGTTYYVIKVTDNLVKLATTYAQAVSNTPIDILTAPAGAWTLKVVPLSLGTAGYTWQASNDQTNWVSVESSGNSVGASSQTLTAMGVGTRLYDWSTFAYRYLRFTFNGPISGVIRLRALLSGKE